MSFTGLSRHPLLALVSRVLCASVIAAGLGTVPAPAQAWDVASTHLQLSESAILASSAHRVWMDASGMRIGLFSRLRLRPESLNAMQLFELDQAISKSPDRAQARPRGGEPQCPPKSQEASAQECARRRAWSQDALAWLRLGVLTAARSPHLLANHIALPLPGLPTTTPQWFLRAQQRHNHAPLAGRLAGENAVRRNGPSALFSASRGWSLRDLSATMAASALAPSPLLREEALAQSLILWGIALHAVQDQSVPAHARGELEGIFEQLSRHRHDQGSWLAEWTKRQRSRADIEKIAKKAEMPALLAMIQSWPEALSRQAAQPSIPRWVSRHFISPALFPQPRKLDIILDPQQAANELLAGVALHLRSAERDGLVLDPWPARAGYLRTASGRILAAYQRDNNGAVRLHEDQAVLAENAQQLLGLASASSQLLLNRAWQAPPEGVSDPTQSKLWREGWTSPRVVMLKESPKGAREVVEQWQDTLPNDAALQSARAKASVAGHLPIFVVYEGSGRHLPRLLHWRLPTKRS